MKPFWLVWNGGDWTEFQRCKPVVEHLNPMSAHAEAVRLARANPGTKFYVLEAVEYVVKADVTVVPIGERDRIDASEEIPF